MTIAACLHQTSAHLRARGVLSPKLDAEVLLAHVLKKDRSFLFAHDRRELTVHEQKQFGDLLDRRLKQEPVAYLTGHKEFLGLDLLVSPDVLIPRPETETLVEMILNYGAHKFREVSIVDVGTGSGAIALALAVNTPSSVTIYALDSSDAALVVAQQNASRLHLSDRITFLKSNLLEFIPRSTFHVPRSFIIANLPYLSEAEYEEAIRICPEVAFEPKSALVGGHMGLEIVTKLLAQAALLQIPPLAIFCEIGAQQGANAVRDARTIFPDRAITVAADLAGKERFLCITSE